MLMSLLDSIASVAAPVLGGLTSGLLGSSAQNSANKANLALAKYQYEQQLDMWNKENAYNSPSAQMQRLQDAGLNPYLVYGSGSVTGSTTSVHAPEYDAPRIEKYNAGADIGAGVQSAVNTSMALMMQHQQIQESQSRINKNNVEAVNDVLQRPGISATNDRLHAQATVAMNTVLDQILKTTSEGQKAFTESQAAKYNLDNILPAQLDVLKKRSSEIASATSLNDAKSVYTAAVTSRIPSEIAKNFAAVRQLSASAQRSLAEISLVPYKARLLGADYTKALAVVQNLYKDGDIKTAVSKLKNLQVKGSGGSPYQWVGTLLKAVLTLGVAAARMY